MKALENGFNQLSLYSSKACNGPYRYQMEDIKCYISLESLSYLLSENLCWRSESVIGKNYCTPS